MSWEIKKTKEEINQLGILLNSTISRYKSNKLSDITHNWTNFWVTVHRIMPYTLGHIDAITMPLVPLLIILHAFT